MFSRRSFVRASSLSLGALALARSLGAQQVSPNARGASGQAPDAPGSSHAIFSNPDNTFLASHDMLSQAAFTSQVGSIFHVVLADRTRLPMRLISVAALSGLNAYGSSGSAALRQGAGELRAGALRTPGVMTRGFSMSAKEASSRSALEGAFRVQFRMQGTGPEAQLAQGSYVVESGIYGPAAMFLVPGGDPVAPSCSALFLSTAMV